MNILKEFKRWIFHKEIHTNHSGIGFIQGTGFDVDTVIIKICGLQFISEIKIEVDEEWLRKLKIRILEDDKQQSIE